MKKIFVFALFSMILSLACYSTAIAAPSQNERFVMRSMQTWHAAQVTYAATGGNGNYASPSSLLQLNLIDAALASGLKYGYTYQIGTTASVGTTPARFYVSARPTRYGKSGRKSFYIDETGVLRGADKAGAWATATDPSIEIDCAPVEPCAISNLRWLHGAETTYAATIGAGVYATLNQLFAANLISENLADGTFGGYLFTVNTIAATANSPASFNLRATPIQYVSGRRSFYIGADSVLRGADKNGEPADENDPTVD